MPRTKVAVNAPVGLRFPPARFVKLFRLLEDLQLFHGSSSQSHYTLYVPVASQDYGQYATADSGFLTSYLTRHVGRDCGKRNSTSGLLSSRIPELDSISFI